MQLCFFYSYKLLIAGNVSARRKQTGKSSVTASVTSMQTAIEEEELTNMSVEELITK